MKHEIEIPDLPEGWQPIDENTPKDRHVLLYGGHVPCCQMFVGHANANWSWEPTHWQELPEDPK